MPTRPGQNDPQRVAEWERRRHEVGARIRDARVSRGLTQEGLALASGVSRNVLIDVEHGKRGLLYERLQDLADALEVPASQLLSGEKTYTSDATIEASPTTSDSDSSRSEPRAD